MLLKGGTYERIKGRKLIFSREYTEYSIYWIGSEHFAWQRTINDHSKKFGSSVALRAIIDEMFEDTKGVIKVINQ
jgi:hypothetical protein